MRLAVLTLLLPALLAGRAATASTTIPAAPAGAAIVKARLAPGEPWAACTIAGGAVACPLSIAAAAATSLEIVAAGS